ncbi:hypothetical protein B4119_2225 [Parageobacillus caldoxylosilyticus]|uniref:Uncharacterized protein n=1 Tax=Saccharococcus caldoxylosilyticus TaxID=81408 RepID=A0A150LU84_9BACL|nr:hypothetical protein B4119_2225 [Parageobacillus caldoxylosilyticus]
MKIRAFFFAIYMCIFVLNVWLITLLVGVFFNIFPSLK